MEDNETLYFTKYPDSLKILSLLLTGYNPRQATVKESYLRWTYLLENALKDKEWEEVNGGKGGQLPINNAIALLWSTVHMKLVLLQTAPVSSTRNAHTAAHPSTHGAKLVGQQ